MKNVFRDIEENFQTRELVASFLLTAIFLALAFLGYTRFTTEDFSSHGLTGLVHVSYYGFPQNMVKIYTPVGYGETAYGALFAGAGLIQILWGGLVLDFALYFLLAFAIVYLTKKLRR